ncbi:hypothetical protein GCM10008921_17750 [Metaclostridioides mangenotii]
MTGLSCVLCIKLVERSVCKLSGILNQNLNIEYDNSKVKFNNIKGAIKKAGFGILEGNKHEIFNHNCKRKEEKKWKKY